MSLRKRNESCPLEVRRAQNSYKLARQPTFIPLSQRRWQEDCAACGQGVEPKHVKKKTQVILYTRPGCRLCEEMKQQIADANCAELYSLNEINIERDPALLARYRNDIPVLLVESVEVFRHQLRADAFGAYLMRLREKSG